MLGRMWWLRENMWLSRIVSLERDLAWSRSTSARPKMCGFLTPRRKDFTIQVQVIFRVCLFKLETVKQRKILEEASGECLGGALLWLPRNVAGKKWATARLRWLTENSEKMGPWRQGQGFSPGWAVATHYSTGCKSHGDLRVQQRKAKMQPWEGRKAWMCSRPALGLNLEGSSLFSKGGNIRGGFRGGSP